jgi:hypothetical protein
MALNTIRRKLSSNVIRIRGRGKIRLMTADASIRGIIEVSVQVAFRAIVCDGYVRAGDGPNGGMVKCRRHPRLIAMALNTISRKLSSDVIRVRGRVEIQLMTADASIRSITEVPVQVAFRAVVRDRHVRSSDGPYLIVCRNLRRTPSLRCMAFRAIIVKADTLMQRIGRS